MAFYIIRNEAGAITSSAEWQFPNSELAPEAVVRGYDGQLYLESEAPVKPQSIIDEENMIAAKAERTKAVAAITVTVDNMVFDGDETSQERMGRIITAAQASGADLVSTKTTWVLHDNTVATPTIEQLASALKLAGEEQTRLWTMPYEEGSEAA